MVNEKKETIKRLFFIFIGSMLCAIAINSFYIPSNLLSGGVSGIAMIVQYITGFPTGITVFILNLPIFIIGARLVDKDFAIFSFISMLIFSFLLTLTDQLRQFILVEDVLLGAIFGGVLNGTGMGILFRNRSSQGGLDIVAAVLKRKYNINIGTGLMMVNTVIISLSSFLFGIKSAMYTLIALYISYQVLDKVQTGFNIKKNVFIVSNKSVDIADAIMIYLNRGVTLLEGMGAYTKENKQVIYCTIKANEVIKLKNLVDKVDPGAFLTINDAVEVKGSSFKDEGI